MHDHARRSQARRDHGHQPDAGAFRDNAATRRELLAMIGNRGSTILSE